MLKKIVIVEYLWTYVCNNASQKRYDALLTLELAKLTPARETKDYLLWCMLRMLMS